jgi:ABC-type transport system involved in cytochrome bd biosynthesis fused ATPase/permease subunit
MPFGDNLGHYQILTAMLAPALLMAATGSLLISANNRLARVVDRLRGLVSAWIQSSEEDRAVLQPQIHRHRRRSYYVLRSCVLFYAALGAFVGTSLALALDAYSGFALGQLPSLLAVVGVSCLLLGSFFMGLEVSLAVRSLDEELDNQLATRR